MMVLDLDMNFQNKKILKKFLLPMKIRSLI